MAEIENNEQIAGHGTPKVEAVIPESGGVSGVPLLGFGLALFWKMPSLTKRILISGTAMSTAATLPINWIQLKYWETIYQAVARGGAAKVDAMVPDRGAPTGVYSDLHGCLAGLTPRANIVIPDWKVATALGCLLGSSVRLLIIGETPSTMKSHQDFVNSIYESPNGRWYPPFVEATRMPRHKYVKEYARFYGSTCGGMMGGVFVGTYCGFHNFLAKKRGVEDAYNHLAANWIAITAVGCLPHLSTHNRKVNFMRAFVGGCAIALVHLKTVNSNDEPSKPSIQS